MSKLTATIEALPTMAELGLKQAGVRGELKLMRLGDFKFVIRPGTTDEKVIPEVLLRREYFRHIPAVEPGEIWLDLGANIGAFSVATASVGAIVRSYEPEPENFTMLRANILLNRLSKNVEAFNYAVGAKEGTASLYRCRSPKNRYRHTLIPRPIWDSINVPVRNFWDQLDGVTGVKMDIEGSELEIFDKAKNWKRYGSLCLSIISIVTVCFRISTGEWIRSERRLRMFSIERCRLVRPGITFRSP